MIFYIKMVTKTFSLDNELNEWNSLNELQKINQK